MEKSGSLSFSNNVESISELRRKLSHYVGSEQANKIVNQTVEERVPAMGFKFRGGMKTSMEIDDEGGLRHQTYPLA